MLALIYLAIVIWVGDRLTRSVYRFLSIPHRFSSAFLVGLITSTWITYLGSALFGSATKPLIYGNLLYLAVAGAILTLYGKHPSGYPATLRERPEGSAKWDWAFMLFFFLAVSWLMFGTLSSHNGMLRIADKPYSDFGPNIAPGDTTSLPSIPIMPEIRFIIISCSTLWRAISNFSASTWRGASIC
jgi:hypothetical protein